MNSKKEPKECYLCGKKLYNKKSCSKDHIPPKSIYLKNPTGKLITVTSCHECNNNFSSVDEQFATSLAIYSSAYSTSAKDKWEEKTKRSVGNNRKLKTFHSNNIEMINVVTEKCITNAVIPAYKVDTNITNPSIVKIVKGLFYHHTEGKRLINEPKIAYLGNDDNKWFYDMLEKMEHVTIEKGTFSYAYMHSIDNEEKLIEGIFVFFFYDTLVAIAEFSQDNIII